MKLAEGRRTEVFLIETRRGKAILKRPKRREFFRLLRNEYEALRLLNELSIEGVPRVYELTDEGLLEEFIPGEPFGRRKENRSPEEIRNVIRLSLYTAFLMDLAGVRHKELSLAHKHVLVAERPYIIDFGHSKLGVRRRSLPQLAAYFFFRNGYTELFGLKKNELVEALRRYKRGDPRAFIELIDRGPRRP